MRPSSARPGHRSEWRGVLVRSSDDDSDSNGNPPRLSARVADVTVVAEGRGGSGQRSHAHRGTCGDASLNALGCCGMSSFCGNGEKFELRSYPRGFGERVPQRQCEGRESWLRRRLVQVREHDHRSVIASHDVSAARQPVHVGHLDVQRDHVRLRLFDFDQRVEPI